MDMYEEAVMWYVSAYGKRFLVPQYSIRGGWSLPDFVALDFEEQRIYVVEVTVRENVRGIGKKIRERRKQWLNPLRNELRAKLDRAIPNIGKWKIFVVAFVRKDKIKKLQELVGRADDVSIKAIEDVMYEWTWDWKQKSRPANALI